MSHTLNLDQALVELGQFGRYQRLHFCLLVVPVVYSAIRAGNFIFNAADPGYRCLVPECESSPAQWAPGLWASWALVAGSHCERRAPAAPGGDCLPATFGDATQPCDAWLYANNNTIVYEFDLACQELKRTMVGSTHAFGVFTALFGIGIISDRFGRRATLILTATSCAVAGMTRSFATSYTMYVICEYFDALLGAGVYSTAFVLALEMVGPKMRVLCGSILSCAFAMGQVCLALLAWAVPYWRHLTRIIYGPCFFFIFYYFLVEESIRWLIIKGKKEKATEILLKVAQFNKKHISRETIDRLVNIDPSVTHVGGVKKLSLVCKVLHSRILMQRVLICSFVWITTTFTYYGLSINSVSLAGNMYINYILTSLVEIPGYIVSVYVLDRFGRKVPIIVSLFFCGASLFMLPIISSSLSGLQLAVTLAGKLGASSAASNMHVYTTELFPTGTRHRALTACSTVARLGQAAAMLTPLLVGPAPPHTPYLPPFPADRRAGVAGGDAGHAGQELHQHDVRVHVRVHDGAVPHQGAPLAAQHVQHGGPARRHLRAALPVADGREHVPAVPDVRRVLGDGGAAAAADAGDAPAAAARHGGAGREAGLRVRAAPGALHAAPAAAAAPRPRPQGEAPRLVPPPPARGRDTTRSAPGDCRCDDFLYYLHYLVSLHRNRTRQHININVLIFLRVLFQFCFVCITADCVCHSTLLVEYGIKKLIIYVPTEHKLSSLVWSRVMFCSFHKH